MKYRTFIAITVGLYGVFAGSASAQLQIVFSPATLNLTAGESRFVEINVTGLPAPGLAAFQFDLAFAPGPIDVLNPNEAFRGTVTPFAPLGGSPLCTTVRETPT